MLHLTSIILLLVRITRSKNTTGVSCRMQEMYLIVFVTRYLDLLWSFVSVYNSVMKITYIAATSYAIYLIRFKSPLAETYDRTVDNFPYEKFLLGPCAILALISTRDFSISEILWTFSVWVEAVAIIPQLVLLQQGREVENLTSNFVAAMGAYRLLYILNWAHLYFSDQQVLLSAVIGGVVQTGLYVDFFYYYARSKWYGQKLILPE
jgi:ER lumen protein retaining receptor